MSKSKSAAVASGSPRCLPRFRSPFAEHDERTGEAGGRGADEAAAAAVSLRLPKATTATAAGPTWACWAALAQAIRVGPNWATSSLVGSSLLCRLYSVSLSAATHRRHSSTEVTEPSPPAFISVVTAATSRAQEAKLAT